MTGQNVGWQTAAALATQNRDWPALQRVSSHWTAAKPAAVEAWQALSRSHFEQHQFLQAVAAFDKVPELEPEKPEHLITGARLATAAHQYERARLLLENALAKAQSSHYEDTFSVIAETLYPLARVYHLLGELSLAEDFCQRSIKAKPGFPPAYTLLGALREGQLSDADINAIKNMLAQPTLHPEYRAMLGFTLGSALDKRNDYGSAFAAWRDANEVNQRIYQQEGMVYHKEQQEQEVELLTRIFSAPVQAKPVTSHADKIPVFIVGMPRSGTTLAESILASHSQVSGAGELPGMCEIHDSLIRISQSQGIKAACDTLQTHAEIWRQNYLDNLPDCDTCYIVDKQPLNFRSLGLIRLLFPESPIVYTQRPALDLVFSVYRHNFTKNWPCAHRLEDITHYLKLHIRIMAMWLQNYPRNIHVLDHSALVQNTEHEINRLINFIGLDTELACLAPHKTKRTIATFSAVQVRNPVSPAYSGRALRYLPWLLTEPCVQSITSQGWQQQATQGTTPLQSL